MRLETLGRVGEKRFIDLVSLYKVNRLHLHLADDQGWRIEIKSRPSLTAIGSTTQVGGGAGGFYTHDEYREIVAHAASLGTSVQQRHGRYGSSKWLVGCWLTAAWAGVGAAVRQQPGR